MSDSSPTPPPPRKPFAEQREAEPFHRSPEFQRFVWLLGGLAVVGILGFYFASKAQEKEKLERAATAQERSLPPLLPPQEQEAREKRLSTLLEGSLTDSQNGTDFVETTGYRRLLQIITSYPREEVEQRAVRHLDYEAALADPDAWRGEFVWTRGVIADLWAERLREPLFGMTDVYRGILAEGDGKQGLFFDLPESPPGVDLRKEAVDVFGIFYRTVQYEPLVPETKEQTIRTVPYLVVKTVRRVEKPKSDPAGFLKDHYVVALVGAALVIFTTRLLMYLFQRRSRRSRAPARVREAGFRDMFETKLRQDRRTHQDPHSKA